MRKLIVATSVFTSVLVLFQNCGPGLSSLSGESLSDIFSTNKEYSAEERISIFKMRRLSNDEYDKSIKQIFSDSSQPASKIFPSDIIGGGFDTNAELQSVIGAPIVQRYEELAFDIAKRFIEDQTNYNSWLPCTPSGFDDENCLGQVISKLLKLTQSQTPEQNEIQNYLELAKKMAIDAEDFNFGVEVAIASVLQSPKFLYHTMEGSPVENYPTLMKLDAKSLARRLSLALTSSLPDEELIDSAESGELLSPEGLKKQAQRLLSSPIALESIQKIHAIWLGYDDINKEDPLMADLDTESKELVKKIIWDDKVSWSQLFTYNKTYLNSTLAEHYQLNLNNGNGFQWITYPADSARSGILSHGAFLTAGAKFGDTTPVGRGKYVLSRLLCRHVASPPPELNIDNPPPDIAGTNCKIDRYIAMSPKGTSCYECHSKIDPVGFGLEQFDNTGKRRLTEVEKNECEIDGNGHLLDHEKYSGGSFNGPKELSSIITTSRELQDCFVKKTLEYGLGRYLTSNDEYIIERLSQSFEKNNEDFLNTLLELTTSEEFFYIQTEL